MEEPEVVKTHLRDRTILPEMGGSMVGLYWQDLQPSGNQARDDRSPPGWVLHYLQGHEAMAGWNWFHPLHPPLLARANKDSCLIQEKKGRKEVVEEAGRLKASWILGKCEKARGRLSQRNLVSTKARSLAYHFLKSEPSCRWPQKEQKRKEKSSLLEAFL